MRNTLKLLAIGAAFALAMAQVHAQPAGPVNPFSSGGHNQAPFANVQPTLSACGTSPTITGPSTDAVGSATIGGTGTGCVVTFAVPYVVAPTCVVSGSAATTLTTGPTLTSFTVTAAAATVFSWACFGR